jgi:Na+-driven multidrug efflux pump
LPFLPDISRIPGRLSESTGDGARFDGWAVIGLSGITITAIGGGVVLGAPWLVLVFTRDPTTFGFAVDFARTMGVASVFLGLYFTIRGALQGAGETRIPFVGRLTGSLFLLLGFSYVTSITLDVGVVEPVPGSRHLPVQRLFKR